LGVERELAECGLCAAEPGGNLHARFCQDARVRGHTVIVHDRIKHTLCRLLRTYCHTAVLTESRAPFLAFAAAVDSGNVSLCRMDLVALDAAFAGELFGTAPALMIDTTHAEVQCASQLARALADPAAPCAVAETRKDSCYSGRYDRNCYNRATFAVGSFGVLGKQAEKLLGAMADAWADFNSSQYGPTTDALRSIGIARMRAALSAALHAGLSQRVMAYMATVGVAGSVGSGGGEREGAHAPLASEPPWEAAP
jgi:hypothetical protein